MGGGGGWSQSVPFHKNGKQGTAHSIHCIPSEMPVTLCGVTHTPSLAVMSNKESTFQGNQFGVHFRSCQAKWNTAPWWTKTVARGDWNGPPPIPATPHPRLQPGSPEASSLLSPSTEKLPQAPFSFQRTKCQDSLAS